MKTKMTEKLKKFANNLSAFAGNLIFGVRILLKCALLHTVLYFSVYVLSNMVAVFLAYSMKEIINNIISSADDPQNSVVRIVFWVAAYLVFLLISNLGWNVTSYLSEAVSRKANRFVDEILIEKITIRDLSFFDDPEENNILKIVNENQWLINDISWEVVRIFSNTVSIIAVLGIMISLSPWITLIVTLSIIPTILQTKKYNYFLWRFDWEKSTDYKKTWYYQNLMNYREYGEEMRLYNNSGYYKKIFFAAWENWKHEKTSLAIKHNIKLFFTFLIETAAVVVTFIYSLLKFGAGKIALGDVQYYVTVANQVKNNLSSILRTISDIQLNSEKITVVRKFYDYKPEMQTEGDIKMPPHPDIEFRGVGFKYPKTDKWILRDLSFKIGGREKIAFVGLNGAGKSTIIKLLLRFYDPDEGEILFDGINAKNYDLKSLRATFGAMFQDYITYSMTAEENITLSDYENSASPSYSERLRRSLEFSGADKMVEEFEKGIDTPITRRFDDKGLEPSGGQKQKLALSRSYFRESEIMILDEPSASLDPEAENEIFTKFISLWKDRGAVLISHRLSNVMLCDRIIVIENGKTEESGSHSDLMQSNKKYASLFKLQAGKYMV